MTDLHAIYEERMNDGMLKIHLPGYGVIHIFTRPDLGDPHDHPWDFTSRILWGGYVEERYDPKTGRMVQIARHPGEVFDVGKDDVHRISRLIFPVCVTIIVPRPENGTQTPGFWRWVDGKAWRRDWDGEWVDVFGDV